MVRVMATKCYFYFSNITMHSNNICTTILTITIATLQCLATTYVTIVTVIMGRLQKQY